MKQNKMKVIMVNGTNPNAEEVMTQVKETGCKVIMFTGIGKSKAQKLIDSMPYTSLKFGVFRRLDCASEESIKEKYDVVSTIGDFCKGRGRKTTETKEINEKDAKAMVEKFMDVVRENSSNIGLWGFDHFKELANNCGATKTMRRGTKYYAYFGNMYVRF